MARRFLAMLVAACLVMAGLPLGGARADNAMGYKLLSVQDAAGLPRNGGSLGMDVGRAQRVNQPDMAFDIMEVKSVRRGSPAAQAGFRTGDQIISVDGRVFASIATFASYVGSLQPGAETTIDYMPAGKGPGQAQRIALKVGGASSQPATTNQEPASTGMSTGKKVAIGAAAVALFGCYKMGCFSHHRSATQNSQQPSYPR